MTRARTVLAVATALVGGLVAVPAFGRDLSGGTNDRAESKAALPDSKSLPAVERVGWRDGAYVFVADLSQMKMKGGVSPNASSGGTPPRTTGGEGKEDDRLGPAKWVCVGMSALPCVCLVVGMIRAYARGGRSRPSFHRPA